MSWKDMKLGLKLGVGFGALIVIGIIIGFVGYRSLTSVGATVELADDANTAVKQLFQTGIQRAEFQYQGFKKTGTDNKSSYDRWQEKYGEIEKVFSELREEGQSHFDSEDLQILTEAEGAVEAYKSEFERMASLRRTMDESFAAWGDLGWKITGQVDNANEEVIEPERVKAEQADDAEAIAKWSRIASGLEEDVVASFLLLRVHAVYFSKTLQDAQWDGFQKQLAVAHEGFDSWAAQVQDDSRLRETAQALNGFLDSYEETGNTFYNAVMENRVAEQDMQEAAAEAVAKCNALRDNLKSQMESRMAFSNTFMMVLAIIGTIVGIVLALIITRGIVKPIAKSVELAERIADGDLTHRLDVDQKDEIGQLAKALNHMTVNLNDVMNGINEAAEQVAASSEQLSSSAQSLSSGASEQAASLEETSASIEELTSSVEQNASNAQQANEIADQATTGITETTKETVEAARVCNETVDLAKEGGRAVENMVNAMSGISDSSKRIADIIRVIDDIADQTNLLALNAAIEAARAGEMGKGFAVVAVEVRKLAERSQAAAKEISDMITGSVKQVDEGAKLANQCGESLNKIVESITQVATAASGVSESSQQQATNIKRTAELVQEITAACAEQASGADQINKAVTELDTVTQQNASTSEESASASEELAAQAQSMQAMVARFKITSNGSGHARKGVAPTTSHKALPDASQEYASAGQSNMHDESEF
jgi:methyl-accepting chemotaxis protein